MENMIKVKGGEFTMGDEMGRERPGRHPLHKVILTYGFEMNKFKTTFDEYAEYAESEGVLTPSDGE